MTEFIDHMNNNPLLKEEPVTWSQF